MSEQENTTKVEGEIKGGAPEGEQEELLSLESLDSAIAEVDPEFSQSLVEIGPDDPNLAEIYNESLDTDYTLAEEIKLWKAKSRRREKLATVFPFLPLISYQIKIRRATLRLTWRRWKEQFIHRLKNAGPLLLAWLKTTLGKFKSSVTEAFAAFQSFSGVKKGAFVGLIVVTGVSGYVLYRMATKGLLPPKDELFISSLGEWAQEKYVFDPETERSSFYDSTRLSQNILLMQKMMVNLRPSAESGSTPMGAFEFYVEGAVSEVVVEIKDRESEIEDLFLRTIEEMTYDQVSSGEGKQQLCDRLRKAVNKVLTRGHVRRVFIKTAIIKP